MGLEIERKFLVKNNSYQKYSFKKSYIKQGFLNSHKERVVRIRILDDKAFITIKGVTNDSGTSRYEWEKEIPVSDANELLLIAEKTIIEKFRYHIKQNKHTFEVDEFLGDNKGLTVAEIELSSENEIFDKPIWLGEEVTGIAKYFNASLSKQPFNSWA